MPNNVSTVSFGDYSSEQQDIERRRKMAEALQQQSMQPINNPMSGGYVTPISWTQGLAKMLQAYGGRKGQDEATERQKALAERSKTEAMDFVSTLPQATTQDMNLVANDDEGNAMPPAMKTTQPDQRVMADALRKGMASGNPLIAQIVGPMYAQMLKQNDPYTLAPNAVRMQGDQVIAQGNPQQFRPPDPVRIPQATPMAPGRTRDVQMGTDKVTQELQPDGTWKEIGRGPAFARQVAPVVNVNPAQNKQKAPMGYRFSSDGETLEPIPGGPKDGKSVQLPTQALKLQQNELDAIGTASSISADLAAINKQITDKKIDLGLVSNLVSQGRQAVGLGNEQSRNYNSFLRTLEKMRNDSLRLNKGVQTEGDSVRAWNELMGGLNDTGAVQQRLTEIQQINDRAVNLRKMNIDAIRSNYNADPMDVSGYQAQPAAVGGLQPSVAKPYDNAEKERRYQEWKRNNSQAKPK